MFIFKIIFALSVASFAFSQTSLLGAIKTALTGNPKTRANEARIRAMEERVKAAWLDAFLPGVSVGYTVSSGRGTIQGSDGSKTFSLDRHKDASAQAFINLFNGGADYLGAKAAEANANSTREIYNGTSGYIPNTKGSIANLVVDSYSDAVRNFTNKRFINEVLLKEINLLKNDKGIAPGELEKIQSFINAREVELSSLNNNSIVIAENYKYIVTAPLPIYLDDFETAIHTMEIPPTAEEAINTAMEKNSELKAALYAIEAADATFHAEQNKIYSPKVDLTVQSYKGQSNFTDNQFNSNGTYAGLVFSWSLSPGQSSRKNAAAYEREAAKYQRDSAIEDLSHDLKVTYISIQGLIESYEKNKSVFETEAKVLEQIQKEIASGKSVGKDGIDKAIEKLNNMYNYKMQMIHSQQNILRLKYTIQRVSGTLFDSIGL